MVEYDYIILCCLRGINYDKKECKYIDVLHDLREYKIADGHPKRIIERRELNPNYRGGTEEVA